MSSRKPITAEEAIAALEKRRQRARDYYARMREDARAFREAKQVVDVGDDQNDESSDQ